VDPQRDHKHTVVKAKEQKSNHKHLRNKRKINPYLKRRKSKYTQTQTQAVAQAVMMNLDLIQTSLKAQTLKNLGQKQIGQ